MDNAFPQIKDPFHLPRALMHLVDLFENRLSAIPGAKTA
jgi:hypothetical protein